MNTSKILISAASLIVLITLGFIMSMPDYIPAAEIFIYVFILIVYVLVIMFTYLILMQLRNYFYSLKPINEASLYTKLSMTGLIMFVLLSFVLTSFNLGQGFAEGKLAREIKFNRYRVNLFIYDDTFIEPITTIKLKSKSLPIMEPIGFIENSRPSDLQIIKLRDTLIFSGQHAEIRFNLKSLKTLKVYKNKKTEMLNAP